MRGAALALTSAALLAGCGGSDSAEESPPATRTAVREALESRLLDKKLSFEWVYCLRTPRTFGGDPIFRCNVNFGEPHIVIYCVTLRDGELVTNREQPAIRCGRGVS